MPGTAADGRRHVMVRLLNGALDADEAASELGVSRRQALDFRRRYLRSKLPMVDGRLHAPVERPVRVLRDRWGIPHLQAESVVDGYRALGYTMAQDRSWQLDYFRRQARGCLAEVLGRAYVVHDRLHRTIGLTRAAEAAASCLSEEVHSVLEGLAAGINAGMEATAANPAVEFDLLGYAPQPWTLVDTIVVWKWRWWMLTGRLGLLTIAEAARRCLPPDMADLFMSVEAGEETIIPSEEPAGIGGEDTALGSNNWVVGGRRTRSGGAILATDPHNSVSHPSQWYEAQLTAPGIDAIGAFYLGTPGVYLGHTRRTAWGVTNHTASCRDLYRETVSQDNPDRYLEKGEWRPFETERVEIPVRGQGAETMAIRRTVRGPVMNAFVPDLDGRAEPPLSMSWVGAEPTTGFDSLLGLLRSRSADDVLAALEGWPCPILNVVFADDAGRIGYHVVGRVPVRGASWLGYRPAGDPVHAWTRMYAFHELPHEMDPERNWVATANNPPWGGNGPYLRLGSWADGYRFRRIRGRIEAEPVHSLHTVAGIHADTVHGRAVALAPAVAAFAREAGSRKVRELGKLLASWDGDFAVDEVAPSVFTAFWESWLQRMASVRFSKEVAPIVKDRMAPVAAGVLTGAVTTWLPEGTSVAEAVAETLLEAEEWLRRVAGGRRSQWRWGRLHTVTFPHPISQNDALAETFDLGPNETSGGNGTVRAAGYSTGRPFVVTGLSTYRMAVDMSDPAHGQATTTGGQSGHPGSPHYGDQAKLWLADDYHPLLMDEEDVRKELEGELVLESESE